MKSWRTALLLSTLLLPLSAATAVSAPDAKTTIQTLDDALLDTMKNADKLGYQGRYDKLAPVLTQSFNMPLMARIAVGPHRASLTPDQQSKVIDAFTRLSIATYAARFDGYDGEQFQILSDTPITGGDEVVNTKMIRPHDEAVDLNYRLRPDNGAWKVIDVFLSGTISQLANYRSEFAATLRSQGPDALVATIEQKVKDLAPKG